MPPLILVLVGIGVYANSLKGPFVFDDNPAILANGDIRQLTPLWRSTETSDAPPINGRPLVRLSLALNYAWGGLQVEGYHAVNIALHIGCTLVFYALMLRALGGWRAALGGALLWLVHPLNSQVVNYTTQRSESLMALCYLGMLYCVTRRGAGWSALAVVCCGLGMASKEVMVTAPVVALVYDGTFVAGSIAAALRARRGLYAGLAATWVLLIVLMMSAPDGDSVGFDQGVGPYQFLLNQCVVVTGYLGKFIWPDPLLLDYGRPRELALGDVLVPMALLLSLLAGSLWLAWRRPRIGFLPLFFFTVLAPTSSVVPLVNEVGADRRVYLPLCGLCALVAAAAGRRDSRLPGGLILVATGALALLTIERNQVYQSRVTLWRADVDALPDNPRGHNNLGVALSSTGQDQAAVPHFQRALDLEPTFYEAHDNLGLALSRLGLAADAIEHYRQALAQNPRFASAHNNLGAALVAAGDSLGARWHFNKSIELDADNAHGYNNLGLLLAGAGDTAQAQAYYRRALGADPDYVQAHVNLGLLLEGEGRLEEAFRHYATALKLKPTFVDAHYNLANALLEVGELDSAIVHYRRALSGDSTDAQVHINLGKALQQQGDWEGAERHYREALHHRPLRAIAHNNLAIALHARGNLDSAIWHFDEAVAHDPGYAVAYYNLCCAHEARGDTAQALEYCRQALHLQPDMEQAASRLGGLMQQPRGR